MTPEQFDRECRYRVAISLAKTMLREGLISDDEYRAIDTIIIEKYRPIFGGLSA